MTKQTSKALIISQVSSITINHIFALHLSITRCLLAMVARKAILKIEFDQKDRP